MNISIIIPFRQDRGYLKQAIQSANNQDFTGTYEIILQKADMSMAENTNEAVRRAKGKYVKWLHDDDMLCLDCLTSLWPLRGADVIFANAINFHVDGWTDLIKSRVPKSIKEMINDYAIHAGTLMYKRKVLLDNPLDETLWTGEEYELNMRLFVKGYTFAYLNKQVSWYRVHPKMKSYTAYGSQDIDAVNVRSDALEAIRDRFRNM